MFTLMTNNYYSLLSYNDRIEFFGCFYSGENGTFIMNYLPNFPYHYTHFIKLDV